MALSDVRIKDAKPKEKFYKLSDGKSLYLLVNPNGSKLWRLKYRFAGKEKTLSFGPYPEVSLNEAREKRDDARAKVKSGIDPSEERREAKRNASQIPTGIVFRMALSELGELTITTSDRRMVLNAPQAKALRAFLIASFPEDKEETC